MEEKIRETITQLNSLIEGMPYKIDFCDPRTIKILDKNARYMSHDMFQSLVNNVKKDGALTSLPLCHRGKDGALLALSGNHRVQAAVHAGIERILVLVIDRELTRDEAVAIQLSHNAIEGKDDPVILKGLLEEIADIDMKLYAGLDSELLKDLQKIEFTTIKEAQLDFKSMTFLFLPEETEEFKKCMEDIESMLGSDENFILSRSHYDEVFKMLIEVKSKFKIVNNPTAFMKIVEMAKSYMETLPPPEIKKDAKTKGGKNHAKAEDDNLIKTTT